MVKGRRRVGARKLGKRLSRICISFMKDAGCLHVLTSVWTVA